MNSKLKNKRTAIIITAVATVLIISIFTPSFSAISKNFFGFGYGYGEDQRPSLSLDPDDAEGCDPTHTIMVTNTGDEEDDDAEGVTLEITVLKGQDYVDYIEYDGYIGHIENAESIPFTFTIHTTIEWDSTPDDEEIKVEITVTNENVWPEHNIGRRARYTLIHCL